MKPPLRQQEKLYKHSFTNKPKTLKRLPVILAQANKPQILKRLSLIPILLIIHLSCLLPFAFCEETNIKKSIRIAILPFENMSEEFCPIDRLMDTVYKKLKDIAEFPSQEEIDRVLMDLRLRHTGFLSTKNALEIGQRLKAQAILTGIVAIYKESPDPQIGLILKLISTTGSKAPLLWMKTGSATGSDMETWFGLNKILDYNQLIDISIEKMVGEIPFEKLKKQDEG